MNAVSRHCRLQCKTWDPQIEHKIKWMRDSRTVYMAVVGIRERNFVCIPFLLVIIHIAAQHGFQRPVVLFHLPTSLYMEC